MSRVTEIKPGMFAEDLSEEERQEEYTLSDEDVADIRNRATGNDDADEE